MDEEEERAFSRKPARGSVLDDSDDDDFAGDDIDMAGDQV